MNTLLVFAVVQAFNLVALAWFNRVALVRILALRQQLSVYKRKAKKPRLRNSDRLFWSLLSKICRAWVSELILVRPETDLETPRQNYHASFLDSDMLFPFLEHRNRRLEVKISGGRQAPQSIIP